MSAWIDDLRFDAAGLVPVVAQHHATGRILMVAWANREALLHAVRTGRATYWSRSRSRLWVKGEESGHFQAIREVRLDCDGDTVLYVVDQAGGVACHTGRASCYYRRLEGERWVEADPVLEDPAAVYGAGKAAR